MSVKNSDIEWLGTDPGDISGVYGDYVIEISARARTHTVGYSASMPNRRTWYVEFDCETIADGEADGLRASKTAAFAVINDHIEKQK
ncbi:hypothetical protein MUG78_16755 [Gordonia alkaliphila]|uniref:hypothetical protein n=1 Tax=Gordonia alkaliphila TaxID=1053547 RepID=UPI001FF1C44A|nr:hypothetical protein [Gordonia alkaliphila]MCK0441052.1 hypothetical protein [Gordonia alkaliphila]